MDETAAAAPALDPVKENTVDIPADLNPEKTRQALANVFVKLCGIDIPILDVIKYARCRPGKPLTGCDGRGFRLLRKSVGAQADLTLCGCATNGWKKANTPDAPTVLTPARAAQEVRGDDVARKRVERKQGALAEAQADLAAILEKVSADVAELAQELANADAHESAARARSGEAAEWVQNLDGRIVVMQRLREKAHADGVAAKSDEIDAHAKAAAIRAKIEATREQHGPEERAARRRVEKLERRIQTYVAYHPEAVGAA